ncbi:MAG TPA: potassium transporter Kup [Micromonosporaceae bacterium]|jgi:KUP system potassium uptake protein
MEIEETPPTADDEPGATAASERGGAHRAGRAALALGALGVVFGDIGTSPLYSVQTVFTADNHAVKTSPNEVYGVISLIFWAITIIVSIKYVVFILRADNGGEGGIMALTALLQKQKFRTRKAKIILVTLGIFGASLFYGDGVITPAISVLSAVEGLKVAEPSLSDLVLPISVGVLTVLFLFQRFGTSVVGRVFGPIMAIWFVVLAISGGSEVAKEPAIVRALSPSYAIAFIAEHGGVAFIALGSVVLAITGAEALYADMGHFGPSPIRLAWFLLVFPALILTYLGQGALVLHSPSAVENPFYLLFPSWSRTGMVFLATIATVIASQAVISGAFSVSRQAFQLGILPQLTIKHTSAREPGQIYAPGINWALFVTVIVIVLGFGSSAALASAYGVAVTGTFILNTVLFLAVVRIIWRKPIWMVVLGGVVFLTVEVSFFAANLTKIVHGGWLPIVVALAVFTALMTWQRGRIIVTRNRTAKEGSLREFVTDVHDMEPPLDRVPGTAVFLNAVPDTAPLALRANVEHNHVLHEAVIVFSIQFARVPHVPDSERLKIDDLGDAHDGITHVTALFGFQDDPDVPRALSLEKAKDIEVGTDIASATYFLSRMTIVRTDAPGMPRWQKRLFLTMAHNAANPVEYFNLPIDRTISMGAQIEF